MQRVDAESRMVVSRGWGWGNGEISVKDTEVSVRQDK